MGMMIRITTAGSFGVKEFQTSATEGGHVCAVKRAIEFLTSQLGRAVQKDAECTVDGVVPPDSPLGQDKIS